MIINVHVLLTRVTASSSTSSSAVTDRAAFSIRDPDLLAVTDLITLHIVAQDGTTVTHTDPARFGFPDVSVGVDLPVFYTAQLIYISCREETTRPTMS